MIQVQIYKEKGQMNRILIKGHAEYAEKGYDIVCSAVSSIVTTTVNNILSFHQSIEVKDENPVEIKVIEHDSITDTLLNNMIDLLKELENQYQKNIRTEEKSEC